jgi:hypothetical protein
MLHSNIGYHFGDGNMLYCMYVKAALLLRVSQNDRRRGIFSRNIELGSTICMAACCIVCYTLVLGINGRMVALWLLYVCYRSVLGITVYVVTCCI